MKNKGTKDYRYYPHHTYLILYIFLYTTLTSCSKDIDATDVVPFSTEKEILNFSFEKNTANASLVFERTGVIDQNGNTIMIAASISASSTTFTPTITISDDATVSPASGVAQDFSEPVTYTVTAEDKSTATYTVTLTLLGNEASLMGFDFTTANNTSLTEDVIGEIAEDNTISFLLPFEADIKTLRPTLLLPDGATSSPAANSPQDFSNPVTYTITALDGSTREYIVTVMQPEMSEREVLNTIYENLTGEKWNFDNLDIINWNTELRNGRVVKLRFLEEANRLIFPKEIESLIYLETLEMNDTDPQGPDDLHIPNLKNLIVSFSQGSLLNEMPSWVGNHLKLENLVWEQGFIEELPESLGNLVNLKSLNLEDNSISKLPLSMVNLKKIEKLNLSSNKIFSFKIDNTDILANLKSLKELSLRENNLGFSFLRVEDSPIFQLNSLEKLVISFNNLDGIHINITQLKKLSFLDISNNSLKKLPFQIENMENLKQLYISNNILELLPSAMGNLPILEILDLSSNTLSDIPTSFAQLTTLREFDIRNNMGLTSIPQSVCDLEKTGTTISKDDTTLCQ